MLTVRNGRFELVKKLRTAGLSSNLKLLPNKRTVSMNLIQTHMLHETSYYPDTSTLKGTAVNCVPNLFLNQSYRVTFSGSGYHSYFKAYFLSDWKNSCSCICWLFFVNQYLNCKRTVLWITLCEHHHSRTANPLRRWLANISFQQIHTPWSQHLA